MRFVARGAGVFASLENLAVNSELLLISVSSIEPEI